MLFHLNTPLAITNQFSSIEKVDQKEDKFRVIVYIYGIVLVYHHSSNLLKYGLQQHEKFLGHLLSLHTLAL
jgi:hypothetical protein